MFTVSDRLSEQNMLLPNSWTLSPNRWLLWHVWKHVKISFKMVNFYILVFSSLWCQQSFQKFSVISFVPKWEHSFGFFKEIQCANSRLNNNDFFVGIWGVNWWLWLTWNRPNFRYFFQPQNSKIVFIMSRLVYIRVWWLLK